MEDSLEAQLRVEFKQLPTTDMTLTAFMQRSKFNNQFIGSLPNRRCLLCARDFHHAVVSMY